MNRRSCCSAVPRLLLALLALLSVLSLPCASADARQPVAEQGHRCHLPGAEEALRCISVQVPLDGAAPNGARIALHVTVAPAFREAAKPDPLFVLAGGPGEAGSDVLPLLANTFRRIRATRDIVFIDQRGTGLSGKLVCDKQTNTDTRSDAEAEADADADAALRACALASRAPLAAYTTANAARDIEHVRLALGYGRINLWGGSYGTRLAQVYARLFPAALRAMVLDGVAAPEQIIPAGGRDAKAALEALFRQCAADHPCQTAFPALRAEFAALSAQLAAGRLTLAIADPRTAAATTVTMTRARFAGTVHGVLYSALDSRRLPFLIHSAYLGRWAPLIARGNLGADLAADGALSPLLHLAVVCAEDMPRLTPALLAEDSAGAFFAPSHLPRMAALCATLHVPAAPAVATSRIGAPVLMLSGTLDPVTPPRRAAAAARAMDHVQQLVVEHAGHGISQLGCMPRLLRAFFDQPTLPVQASCLTDIAAASFQTGNAGPPP